jgi:hypothetical protein
MNELAVVVGAGLLAAGIALGLLGVFQTISRRQMPGLRYAVATAVTGTGIGAFGLSSLILGLGGSDVIGVSAAIVVGAVGLGQLLMATLIRRMRG